MSFLTVHFSELQTKEYGKSPYSYMVCILHSEIQVNSFSENTVLYSFDYNDRDRTHQYTDGANAAEFWDFYRRRSGIQITLRKYANSDIVRVSTGSFIYLN